MFTLLFWSPPTPEGIMCFFSRYMLHDVHQLVAHCVCELVIVEQVEDREFIRG